MDRVVTIAGIPFSSITLLQLLELVKQCIDTNNYPRMICTVNVDILLMAQKNTRLRNILENAWVVTADGMPIVWLSKFIRKSLPERVTGADLTKMICLQAVERDFRPYFFGAEQGVAELARSKMEALVPGLRIMGTCSPTAEELQDEQACHAMITRINQSGANIVFVALGAPKQEQWIFDNLHRFQAPVLVGVGASLDFLSGRITRAPAWMQKLGIEWVFRLLMEPRRLWRRYWRDLSFIKIIWKSYRQSILHGR